MAAMWTQCGRLYQLAHLCIDPFLIDSIFGVTEMQRGWLKELDYPQTINVTPRSSPSPTETNWMQRLVLSVQWYAVLVYVDYHVAILVAISCTKFT